MHLRGVGFQDQGRRAGDKRVSTQPQSTLTYSLPGNQETMVLTACTSYEVC